MDMLIDKIAAAKENLKMVSRHYRRPIIYCSFGKDSICVAHLANRVMGLDWPVMFHREPEFPRKFVYQQRIIEDWNLVVHDYPPCRTSVYYRPGGTYFEVATHFEMGAGSDGPTFILLGVLYEPPAFVPGQYLCALDLYNQPTCRGYDYRWDIGVRGDKDSDAHPHTGKPFKMRFGTQLGIGYVDFAFPLQSWTDKDVTDYILQEKIPVNDLIYELVDGVLVNKEDKTHNADYRPACFRCMKHDEGESVMCPKKGVAVNNVSPQLIMEISPDYLESYAYI
jgi:hypothetical protein